MDTLVQLIGANASYQTRKVLRGVDVTLHRGEIVGLIGVNGAGKSTLVSVLVGRHALDSGHMVLSDESYAPTTIEEAQACGVGVITQNSEPPTHMTVALALFRNTYRADAPHEEVRERALELINSAQVDLDPDAVIAHLDRGRRALVEVVRMLAEEAQLVIIDEVAVTLADYEIAMLHHVLRQLASQGRGILYITHRMDEVQSIVDRVVVLREGSIVSDRSITGLSADELALLLLEEDRDHGTSLSLGAQDVENPAIAVVGVADGHRLNGVDLIVHPGEVLGITGTHDSGVRELVEILAGARTPQNGHVERNGQPVTFASLEEAEGHGVSYLADQVNGRAQNRTLVEGLGGNDLALDAEILRARRMIALVRDLRINTANIHASVEELSGGDQQKAEFIRTIERGGDVLVLAHPTQGVDIGAKRAVFAFLHRLASNGAAVVFLSTDMTELLQWSHRVAVLTEGRLALEGPSETLNEDTLVNAMLGTQATASAGRRAVRSV